MTKFYLLLLLLLTLVSNVFSQKVWYTLTDEDVIMVNGTIRNYLKPEIPGLNIIIPERLHGQTVTAIREGAFLTTGVVDGVFSFKSLTGVKLPSTLKNIGALAFWQNAIDTLLVPYGVEYIASHAFGANAIAKLSLPATLKDIGYAAFTINKLKTFDFWPASLDSIKGQAFGANDFINVSIPKQVRYIGDDCFSYCRQIKTLRFEEGSQIKTIGSKAFQYCDLEKIELPNGIDSIASWAFYYNRISQGVIIPRSLRYIGRDAFSNNEIPELFVPNTLTVDDYFGAFGLNKITKLTLEPGMTKTGCYGANLIKEVIIPQGVKIITQNAFSGNPYTSIIIPESVDSIQGAAFSSSRITSINIPRGLTYLSASLFSHTDLTEFVIPKQITTISNGVFFNCKKLKSVRFESGSVCGAINNFAYTHSGIETLDLPNTVKKVGEYTFSDCANLSNVKLGNGLKSIPMRCFSGSGIKTLDLGNSIEHIDMYAFENNQIEKLNIPGQVATIDNSAFANNKIKKLTLNEGVREIKTGAFIDNELDNITLPQSLVEIGWRAFDNNYLAGMALPGNETQLWYDILMNVYKGGDTIINMRNEYAREDQFINVTFKLYSQDKLITEGIIKPYGKTYTINSDGTVRCKLLKNRQHTSLDIKIQNCLQRLPDFDLGSRDTTIVMNLEYRNQHRVTLRVSDGKKPVKCMEYRSETFSGDDGILELINARPMDTNAYDIYAKGYQNKLLIVNVSNTDVDMEVVLSPAPAALIVWLTSRKGGTIKGEAKQVLSNNEELQTVVAQANEGFYFLGWYDSKGNLFSKEASLQFNENTYDYSSWLGFRIELCAYFAPKPYAATNKVTADSSFKCYPNPTNDFLTIEHPLPYTAAIYSPQGLLVNTVNATQEATQLNMTGLPAGMYLVKITTLNSNKTNLIIKK